MSTSTSRTKLTLVLSSLSQMDLSVIFSATRRPSLRSSPLGFRSRSSSLVVRSLNHALTLSSLPSLSTSSKSPSALTCGIAPSIFLLKLPLLVPFLFKIPLPFLFKLLLLFRLLFRTTSNRPIRPLTSRASHTLLNAP